MTARRSATGRIRRGELGQVQFCPLAAFILCDPKPAVICASPQQSGALRRLGQRKDRAVVFCAAPSSSGVFGFVTRQIGTDHRIFFHAIGQPEHAVAAQIDHTRFMPAHDHRRIPVKTITRLAFSRFGAQAPYFAVLQIDPVYFALLALSVKRVAISGVEQHIKTVAARKRSPVTIANPFLALHTAGSHPVFIVLKTTSDSEVRLRVVERDSIKFARGNLVQMVPIFSATKALIKTAIGSE